MTGRNHRNDVRRNGASKASHSDYSQNKNKSVHGYSRITLQCAPSMAGFKPKNRRRFRLFRLLSSEGLSLPHNTSQHTSITACSSPPRDPRPWRRCRWCSCRCDSYCPGNPAAPDAEPACGGGAPTEWGCSSAAPRQPPLIGLPRSAV